MPERLSPPPSKTAESIQLSEPKQMLLDNGIPVYCFCNPTYDAMRFDMLFEAGQAHQPKLLVANATNSMLREGTKRLSSHRLTSRLDYHGSYIDLSVSKDRGWLTLFCLKRNFRYLLPLVFEMINSPRFGKQDLAHYVRKQKNEFIVNSKKPKQLANRAFHKLMFGSQTPYGQVAQAENFDQLTTTDLQDFHHERYHYANSRILVSGPVSEQMLNSINKQFGGEWGYAGHAEDFQQNTDFKPQFHHIKMNGSLQSAITIGKPMVKRSHSDYAGLLLLNTVLGGYFGSRLMTNVREDKGFTYGIYSQLVSLRKAAYLAIATETGKEVTEAAIREIKAEINRLREETIPEEELHLVRNFMTGSLLRSLDGPYAQAERFKSVLDDPRGMQYYNQALQTIKNTDAVRLKELAMQYLDPEEMLTVVAG